MSLDNAPTIKYSCDQYSLLCDQSARMQQMLASFASSLKTALLLIPDNTFMPFSFETRELNEVKDKFSGCMRKMRAQIENEVTVLLEVNRYVGSMSLQFRKVIDLMKYESDRSQVTLLQLDHQLRLKQKQITDCQNALQNQHGRNLEEKWKQQHYVSYSNTPCEGSTTSYLKLLKQFRNKIQVQITFERQEMALLSASISAKLRELKTKLLECWNLIELNEQTRRSRKPIETRYEENYSEIQRQYLLKEKKVDGFEFNKLQEINKKLKLLEQASISQSHQYFSYSRSDSRQRPMEESEVIALLQA